MLTYFGEEHEVDEEGSFSRASRWKKVLVLAAGASVNILFGLIIYFSLFMSNGNFVSTTIESVVDNSVAQTEGLMSQDKIVAINGKKIRLKSDIDKAVSTGEQLRLKIIRNKAFLEIDVIPQKDEENNKYLLGIVFEKAEEKFTSRVYYSYWSTVRFIETIGNSLRDLFVGSVKIDEFTGPVGISKVVVQTKNSNQYLYILALVSVSLGVTNILPIPPLDGGKILIILLEGLFKKNLKENINIAIQMTGFVLMILLALVVTYNDIIKVFKA